MLSMKKSDDAVKNTGCIFQVQLSHGWRIAPAAGIMIFESYRA
jgi:hypothetical protein